MKHAVHGISQQNLEIHWLYIKLPARPEKILDKRHHAKFLLKWLFCTLQTRKRFRGMYRSKRDSTPLLYSPFLQCLPLFLKNQFCHRPYLKLSGFTEYLFTSKKIYYLFISSNNRTLTRKNYRKNILYHASLLVHRWLKPWNCPCNFFGI